MGQEDALLFSPPTVILATRGEVPRLAAVSAAVRSDANMSSALISVIIPTFNAGHFITEAIDSVLGQTAVPAEIIVVDDGSKDDTRERLARYGRQIRYIHQKKQGVSATRNRGVQEALGEHIAFLDAGDVWHPRKLELQLATLSGETDLGLLGTRTFPWPAA